MSLIGDLVDRLLEPIWEKIRTALGPFGKAFNIVGRAWDSLTTVGQRTRDLIDEIVSEVDEWKNFRENVNFRTRVVSLPAAIDHVQDFIAEVRAAWNSVRDIISQIKSKFETTSNPTEEAEEAIADIENSGFKGVIEKFPKLFKGLEKILGFLALLVDALESISSALDDLKTILDALRDFREIVETGGPLFLSQKNPRRSINLADGGSLKIRVGNLHP